MRKTVFLLVGAALLAQASTSMAREGGVWNYHGEAGPQAWGDLKPEFVMCKMGRNQSPIDISKTVAADLEPIAFDYKVATEAVENTGHTIKVSMAPGSTMKIDGKLFELIQFHFHSPSEHKVDGKAFPMEVHLVHADKDGNLAVIGVLFEEGNENPQLAKLWKALPGMVGQKKAVADKINPQDLFPENKTYYRYSGSLTTPPCSEGVRWFVMTTPVQASKAQIEAFRSAMGGKDTNRPVQPTYARVPVRGQ